MAYGVYLYYCSSRSLRLAASRSLELIIERSHVSIWNWVQRLAPLSERFSVDRRDVKRGSSWMRLSSASRVESIDWLWIAYEPSLDRCLMMMRLSVERTLLMICYLFLKDVRTRYGRKKPILTDKARWYDDEACRCGCD
jgi:transposase-like protein